ncbi:HAD-IIB family hydrolase [Bacillus gobiensis]|uniref:HAD-IIB family hydrolase n=1 Tax=Bacillus gobiensis TaxID=1441095 RepID=UPI003D1E6F01
MIEDIWETWINQGVKIVAFDLDNTLIFENQLIDDHLIDGLRDLKSKGLRLFIVTGRTIQSLKERNLPKYFLDLFEETIFCNDGNVIYNWHSDQVRVLNGLDINQFKQYWNQNHTLVNMVIESNGRFYSNSKKVKIINKYQTYFFFNDQLEFVDLNNFQPENISKIYLFPKVNTTMEELEKLEEIEFEKSEMYFYDDFIKIIPLDTSKAKGFKTFLRTLGFSLSDVIAFGNGSNDVSLLLESKVGVAVKNSEQVLIECADLYLQEQLAFFLKKKSQKEEL